MSEASIPRPPKPFDLLAVAAAFARRKGVALTDPTLVAQFTAEATPQLTEALSDSALLHGARVERLFEATVLSLGGYRLLKNEDPGRVHSAQRLRAPDFRIVLDDSEQWLVEVKNVRCKRPFGQVTRISAAYIQSLDDYAALVGTPLRLAIYWSLWGIWTVVDPQRFRRPGGGLRVTMPEAIMANEFVRLGDVSIATRPPLRLTLEAAPGAPRSLDAGGLARFTIASARLYCGEVELVDQRDRKLAEILLLYGEWPAEGPFAITGADGIAGVEFVARPEEPSEQGFNGIGWASRIFSRYYAAQTLDGERVIQLHGEPAPDWFRPLADWDFAESRLPLWLGHILPAHLANP